MSPDSAFVVFLIPCVGSLLAYLRGGRTEQASERAAGIFFFLLGAAFPLWLLLGLF